MNKDIEIFNSISKSLSLKHKNKEFSSETKRNNLLYYAALNDYNNFKDFISEESFKNILKEKKRRTQKRYRVNQKIKPIIPFDIIYNINLSEPIIRLRENIDTSRLVFVTCTFNDKALYTKNGKPKQERTRTKKVNQWFRKHFAYSVVNIDYGDKNEREHHHAIAYLNSDEALENKKGKYYELVNKDYTLGFEPTIEKIKISDDDIKLKKVSNYLIKITNHSNKPSSINRRIRVLY